MDTVKFTSNLTAAIAAQSSKCVQELGSGSFGKVLDRTSTPKSRRLKVHGHTFRVPIVAKILTQTGTTAISHTGYSFPFLFKTNKSDTELRVTSCTVTRSAPLKQSKHLACPKGFSVVSEIIGNLLCNKLYFSLSPHFTYCDGWAVCERKPYATVEIFFEKVTYDLLNFMEVTCKVSRFQDRHIDSIIFPVLHSLWLMRQYFNMSHHDCFGRNIFIVSTDRYEWKQKLKTVSHFCYHVRTHRFYLPNVGFIVKLGDLGNATFTYGRVTFTNTFSEYKEGRLSHLKHDSAEYPDWLDFLSSISDRFSQSRTIHEIKSRVFPFESLNGFTAADIVDEPELLGSGDRRLPSLETLLLHSGVFDHLRKKPTGRNIRILHVGVKEV